MFESRKGNRDSRIDFERELNILVENVRSGKVTFSPETKGIVKDLVKVRSSPNKRFDLNTISEIVRAMAMSARFPRH
ncbi:hypothetical protein EG338_08735 [Kaistella haifensis]|jgi:hypothetical protein|uniref:hypothetical protein n=1 Tax=Chryseobacterium sp. 5_R23647 TaxID=2258964 RepID=UPI000E252A5E|nr:hypothetical protein [Chryseobacterium sp. 5_R23647]AZB22144.1 hypothetical protein EG338_08735 [Kaistella haifensis]REC40644.1 hypothetical protein DRF69_17775 [Chryseobacterium sp. 5_R23647]